MQLANHRCERLSIQMTAGTRIECAIVQFSQLSKKVKKASWEPSWITSILLYGLWSLLYCEHTLQFNRHRQVPHSWTVWHTMGIGQYIYLQLVGEHKSALIGVHSAAQATAHCMSHYPRIWHSTVGMHFERFIFIFVTKVDFLSATLNSKKSW